MNYKVNGVWYSEAEYKRLFGKKEKPKKKQSHQDNNTEKLEKKEKK